MSPTEILIQRRRELLQAIKVCSAAELPSLQVRLNEIERTLSVVDRAA
jgi:hypothetical protein